MGGHQLPTYFPYEINWKINLKKVMNKGEIILNTVGLLVIIADLVIYLFG